MVMLSFLVYITIRAHVEELRVPSRHAGLGARLEYFVDLELSFGDVGPLCG